MRINEAAATHSFVGNFVYLHDHRIEAMQVIRRIQNGMMQERLYALNGEAREVVRDADRVWCFIPDMKVGLQDYRQILEGGFPQILPGDLESLGRNYQFAMGVKARIAKRTVQQVKIMPTDRYRYGYHLWADHETGLVLRSDLIDDNEQIVERTMFVDIQIDPEIPDEALQPTTNLDGLKWFGMGMPKVNASIQTSAWQVDSLPAGYWLSNHIRRMNPMSMEEEEHMVLTDGLSSVSVFVKKPLMGQPVMAGPSRMGAVHAYRVVMADHWVTVMGEVPPATVEHLAQSIRYRP